MTEPISVHNVPAQLNLTGRPEWDQKRRNQKSHDLRSDGDETARDDETTDGAEGTAPSRPGSDGIIGTQVDIEA